VNLELSQYFFLTCKGFRNEIDRCRLGAKSGCQVLKCRNVAAYHRDRQGKIAMRLHNIIAIATAFIFGFGVKGFLSSPPANASHDAPTSAGLNVLQMQLGYPDMKNMPVQKVNDTTFVFSDDR
jgi:hypothetical protein